MKDQQKNLALVKVELPKAVRNFGKSYAEIGRIAGVHGSQVSRICKGEFETLSQNVVQVCKVLGLPMAEVALAGRGSRCVGWIARGSQTNYTALARCLGATSRLRIGQPARQARREKERTSLRSLRSLQFLGSAFQVRYGFQFPIFHNACSARISVVVG
ncbi:MAG: helix-turn-helix transcriptional regulator [Afipia sp.]|nr:helix-turn-helix transcriptional regulator [Afipia sp.]